MKNKYVLLRIIVIVLLVSLTLTACGKDGLSVGFEFEPTNNIMEEVPNIRAAYKSDKTEFDIDDVVLTFSYGGHYGSGIEHTRETSWSFPVFELAFLCDGNRYLIKRVEENLVSEKYSYTPHYAYSKENIHYIKKIDFNHSEEIKIPKEVFNKESGTIYFELYSENIREIEMYGKRTSSDGCAYATIYYKLKGDKVILSGEHFD